MGCLTGAANGDIADGDDGYGEGTAFQDTHLKEGVPETDCHSVDPTQREQLLVDIDKVAFNSHFSPFYVLLHPGVLQHSGLKDGVVATEVATNLHERLVEVAQQESQFRLQFAVEIGTLVFLRQELV